MIRQFTLLFLEQLAHRLPDHASLVKEVASALGIHESTAYRKIKGQIDFSMSEVLLLAERYGLSLDTLLYALPAPDQDAQAAATLAPAVGSLSFMLEQYQAYIWHLLAPGTLVCWIGADLPCLYWMQYPALAAFKLQMQQYKYGGAAHLHGSYIDPSPWTPEQELQRRDMAQAAEAPATEAYWTPRTLMNTIDDLRYAIDNQLFGHKADAVTIAKEYAALLKALRGRLTQGADHLPDFTVYASRLTTGENHLSIYQGDRFLLIDNWNSPYLMISTAERWRQRRQQQLTEWRRHSICISGEGESVRRQFFQSAEEALADLFPLPQ
jgi:hypothetical protein